MSSLRLARPKKSGLELSGARAYYIPMMTSKQKYNVALVKAALELIESRGMTIEKLRNLRDDAIKLEMVHDEVGQMYYDALVAAIEIMERPLFM